jgi:hypothetical protein
MAAYHAGWTLVDGIKAGDHVRGMRGMGCNDDQRARRLPLVRNEVGGVPSQGQSLVEIFGHRGINCFG